MTAAIDTWQMERVKRGEKPYIACADWNFAWLPSELETVINLFNNGASVQEIAWQLGRDKDETGLLIYDLYKQGIIER